MNRRAFLSLAAAAALDPDRLLWIPGRKLISIPAKLAVVPPCPFRIYAHMQGDEAVAGTMNGLLRHRWRSDSIFGLKSRMRSRGKITGKPMRSGPARFLNGGTGE